MAKLAHDTGNNIVSYTAPLAGNVSNIGVYVFIHDGPYIDAQSGIRHRFAFAARTSDRRRTTAASRVHY